MKLRFLQRKTTDSSNDLQTQASSAKNTSSLQIRRKVKGAGKEAQVSESPLSRGSSPKVAEASSVQPKKNGSHPIIPPNGRAAPKGVALVQETPFLSLPKDVQLKIARDPNLNYADWRSMQLSCRALRDVYQSENLWRERARNLFCLPECVFDHPDFGRFTFNYRHLVGILFAGGEGLSRRIRHGAEPWQLAALLGLEDQLRKVYQCPLRNVEVSQRMKDPLLLFEDEYESGIRDYFILGNQEEKLVSWMKYYKPMFKASDDPLLRLPILAVSVGGIPMLQCLVKNYGYDIKAIHPENESSLLYYAVYWGQRKMTNWLINQGLSITKGIACGKGRCFADIAAGEGHWEIYHDLVALGAVPTHDSQYDDLVAQGAVTPDLLTNNDFYGSIMCSAVRHGNKAIYEIMSKKAGITLAKLGEFDRRHYFKFAFGSGNREMIVCALDEKTGWGSIKCTFDDDQTVLHVLARKGHVASIAWLLGTYPEELDPRATTQTGYTILHWSVDFGSYRATKQLYLDYFAPIEQNLARDRKDVIALLQPTNRGETIVHLGARCDHVNFLHLLRNEYGDEPFKVLDKANNSALHSACFAGAYKVTLWLIKIVRLSLTAVNVDGDTPLHVLVKRALQQEVEWVIVEMITAGVDYSLLVNYKNKAGETVRDLMARDSANDLVLQDLEERAAVHTKSWLSFK